MPGRGPLARVPPLAAFVVVAAWFSAGVLIGGAAGAAVLVALAALVAALLALTWPRLAPAQRVLRVVVLFVLLAIAMSLLA